MGKNIIASCITALVVSGIEFYNPEFSIYDNTLDWAVGKLRDLINWLKWW